MPYLCLYLVNCMDERGYMDCPLEEIAEEVGCSVYDVEQALFTIQMLDPPGVGARKLSECLVLQLSQSSHFNALTVHIAQEGLFLLASHNYAELSKRLHTTQKAVRRAADILASLNPIPSRGFGNHEYVNYCIPDASIYAEHGQLVVELNRRVLPQVSINREYCALLDTDASPEIQQYVRENFNAANKLIEGLQKRSDTLEQLLKILVAYQRGFFLNGGDILPITMTQAAQEMAVNVSTVSRAIKNKSIQFQGKVLPLRGFFSSPVQAKEQQCLSRNAIKKRLSQLIAQEDSRSPLSDDSLRVALSSDGIEVSRRMVAKYRSEMGILPSAQRKNFYA